MRGLLMLALALAISGCSQTTVDRASLNDEARSHTFASGLSIQTLGGTILETADAEGDCPAQVMVRAQSFDVRVDVQDTGCGPQALHLTVTHLPRGIVTRTARAFLGAVEAKVTAAGTVLGGGLTLGGDRHDPSWTPLAPERRFTVDVSDPLDRAGRKIEWTICTDRNRQVWRALPGHRAAQACRFDTVQAADSALDPALQTCSPRNPAPALVDPQAGACTTFDAADGDPVPTAPFIVRHRVRLRLTAQDCFRFATWGNNANQRSIRERILQSVDRADPLFVIITGDMTSSGSRSQLEAARAALDGTLNIPWYATLGDREAVGDVADAYTRYIGASTFAFDAGPARIIVLDSGDLGLASADRRDLSTWLTPGGRLWWSTPPPPARIVLTHVPPFDPAGARDGAFRHRPEAAAFVAALQRGSVDTLFSSQFAIYQRQPVADTNVIHSGGAGAPMELTSNDAHHWLLVTVDPGCDDPPPCAAPELGCPCIEVTPVLVGDPAPELPTCRPASVPVIDGL